ncbi:ParB N-terminal domain-containing protein, partial [Methylobacterium sp. Leaf91]|uniref:ParB N-terminal domain-containing protein n=1 Tax=Methylobacterium sp. Leaf91 TaxID=1736247 RepID=UPI00244EEDF2
MTTNAPAFPTAGLTILDQAPSSLKPNPRNARTHSKKQIAKIADSIRAFGFTVPLVVDETGLVLA